MRKGRKGKDARRRARDIVGSPRPVKVHQTHHHVHHKPEYTTPRPSDQPPDNFNTHQPPPERVEGTPRLSEVRNLNVHVPYSKPPQRPSQKHGKTYTFTPEVIAHANYLRQFKGEQEANDYLKKARDSMSMQTQEDKNTEEVVQTSPEEPKPMKSVGKGSVEAAIDEVESTLMGLRRELVRVSEEITRHTQTLQVLQSARNLLTAPGKQFRNVQNLANPGASVSTEGKATRISWQPLAEEILKTSPYPPTRKELCKELQKMHPEATELRVMQYIYSAVNAGKLVLKVDKVHIPGE